MTSVPRPRFPRYVTASARRFSSLVGSAILIAALPALGLAGKEPPPLFALDNGVGRGSWSPEQQARTLRELGYQGISYNYTTPSDLQAWVAELAKAQLKLFGLYLPGRLGTPDVFPPGLAEAVDSLRDTGAALWLTLPNPARPGDHDAAALRIVQQAADLAASAGVNVVLYPHKGFYVATAEQAYALATRARRANVGVTVNLAHELAGGNGYRLPEVIRHVAPLLRLVTINGATDRSAGGWDSYIKILGEGDYDVAAVLRVLDEVHYAGPVGLQFYNVKGDPRPNLQSSMRAWRTLHSPTP